jgi:hypothetical protein
VLDKQPLVQEKKSAFVLGWAGQLPQSMLSPLQYPLLLITDISNLSLSRVPGSHQVEAEVTFCCSTQHCTYIHTDGFRGAFSRHHHRPRHWVQEVPRSRRQPHREDRAQPRVVHGHQRAAQGPGARELHRPRGRRAGRAWPTVPTAGVRRRLRPGTWDAGSGASDSCKGLSHPRVALRHIIYQYTDQINCLSKNGMEPTSLEKQFC